MHCEPRVGNYNGDIGELARQYSKDFMPIPIGRPEVHKYGLIIREPPAFYLLMVSNSDYKGEPDNPAYYSVIATLLGKDKERVKELMKDFEKGFALNLRQAPNFLREQNETLAVVFERMGILNTLAQVPLQTVYQSGNGTIH